MRRGRVEGEEVTMRHGKTVKQIPVSTGESRCGRVKRKAENIMPAFEGCSHVYLSRHGSSLRRY